MSNGNRFLYIRLFLSFLFFFWLVLPRPNLNDRLQQQQQQQQQVALLSKLKKKERKKKSCCWRPSFSLARLNPILEKAEKRAGDHLVFFAFSTYFKWKKKAGFHFLFKKRQHFHSIWLDLSPFSEKAKKNWMHLVHRVITSYKWTLSVCVCALIYSRQLVGPAKESWYCSRLWKSHRQPGRSRSDFFWLTPVLNSSFSISFYWFFKFFFRTFLNFPLSFSFFTPPILLLPSGSCKLYSESQIA